MATRLTRQAQKDARKLAASGLRPKAEELLDILTNNPLQNPPTDEKLVGDLAGAYSRRINVQHRLVYQVLNRTVTLKGSGCGPIMNRGRLAKEAFTAFFEKRKPDF